MKKTYPTYEEAQKMVQKQGIKSNMEYRGNYKLLGLPSAPDVYYTKTNKWIDWPAFLGYRKKEYPTFEEAKRNLQENGICNQKDYKSSYKRLGLPAGPDSFYKDEWCGWGNFLGKKPNDASIFPSYENAQRIVVEKGISSHKEYKASYKNLGLPSNPNSYYSEKWCGWDGFFGRTKVKYPSYEKAQRIVMEKGISSQKEYFFLHTELGLPLHPDRCYAGKGWCDWSTFLGMAKVEYPSFDNAKLIVRENGISSSDEYSISYKKYGLPSDPYIFYKEKGWVDWYDFLGKSKRISFDERKYRILTKLSLSPILLQEDAPLQVIYILASELDKRLAKEMEELLGITTFEERLNWVKEQLKKLKEGCTTISKTIEVTPSDELSAMESILEEFNVTDKVSFTLENYLHSAVNRELISEYDG